MQKEPFDVPAGCATAEETRGEDACVVEDQAIAAGKVVDAFAEHAVLDLPTRAVQDEQTRRVAALHGMLGDQLRRQVVLQFGKSQAAPRTGDTGRDCSIRRPARTVRRSLRRPLPPLYWAATGTEVCRRGTLCVRHTFA